MSKYGEYRKNREDGGDKVEIQKNKEEYKGIEGNMGGFEQWGWGVVWNCNCPRPLHNKYYVTFIMSPPIITI